MSSLADPWAFRKRGRTGRMIDADCHFFCRLGLFFLVWSSAPAPQKMHSFNKVSMDALN